ncbi:patatin-like phospholipase family protein [Dyella choica]|uniref:Patatin-like phospholipase family protein n=1 Tax=Dyella choica TaxID=1927959 RepID=A0A432M881_9GAMM|nr:patatin-like phospholipase family protein [Dyella choica]RUL76634.1 patatin-like phospholipase family protein [Dyella choica]
MLGKVNEVRGLDFGRIETLVLAGGGNRCWWQAGALQHLLEHRPRLPRQLIGTSAGAGIAASFLAQSTDTALRACLELFAGNPRIFDWSALPRLKLKFAHQQIYPAWIEAFLNSATFSTLRHASSQLTVGLSRPAKYLGTGASVAMGTLAYLVDKYWWNSIHPRLPGLLGLRQDFMLLNDCTSVEAAQAILIAAASAPPIMAARKVGGQQAFDGGYTDNAPIPPQSDQQRSQTLVMLTRHYPKLPQLFTWLGRTYWQPSQRIPVSTWDCTAKATVREAYELGLQDSVRVLGTGLIR